MIEALWVKGARLRVWAGVAACVAGLAFGCGGSGTKAAASSGTGGGGGAMGTGGGSGGAGASSSSSSGASSSGASSSSSGGGASAHGPPATQTVSAGVRAKSTSYVMDFTLGQPTQNQDRTTSPSYVLQGGLVGANGSLP